MFEIFLIGQFFAGQFNFVSIDNDKVITVTGALKDGKGNIAHIGVFSTNVVFTSSYGANNKGGYIISPSTYFIPDVEGYVTILVDGEVKIVEGMSIVTVDGEETAHGSIEDAWTTANGAASPATVKLFADATTTDRLIVAGAKDVTLDLNGRKV